MALSFTPKFANMVRVTTSTQGTGPFLCGPAVTGFASFAESVSAGDSFYYSVQGVDKPQEREVGRGTYQADGTITRQPLDGELTKFTPGAKTIALVAAAEWYANVQESLGQGGGGGKSDMVKDRAALAALDTSAGSCLLQEAGREGLFSWDPAVAVAVHQSDPGQGLFVAPSPTAAGAWVRRFSGGANVRWFGAKGDGATNDGVAFTRAVSCLRSTAQQGFGYGSGGHRLYVPKGHYFLGTTTLEVTASLVIEGDSNGLPSGGASVLRWSANTTGIRIQGGGTVGAEGTKTQDYVTGTSLIRGLHLTGGYTHGTTAEGEFHGIHMRAMAAVEDCFIRGFQGDGIHIRGDVNVNNNTNLSFVSRTSIETCRNGVFLQGGDANACSFIHLNVNSNRRWGVLDASFLGNSFFGCHSATNGAEVTSGPSLCPPNRCVHNGNVYALKHGEDAWAASNPPSGNSANNQGWYFLGAGTAQAWNNIEAWTSGRAYRSGGSYAATDANNRTVFLGCYSEGDMAPNQLYGRSAMFGGLHECGVRGQATWMKPEYDGLRFVGNPPTFENGFKCFDSMETSGSYPLLLLNGTTKSGDVMFRKNGAYRGEIGSDDTFLTLGHYNAMLLKTQGVNVAEVGPTGISLSAGKSLMVNYQQVVGARLTGWTAATGSPNRGSFAAAAAGSASTAYVQAEAQESRTRIAALEARLIALEADCRTHGLIN
ncbi:glycosyl hydrolase family 28-related protein [Sphingomonas sp. LHG3443-2]|uniref:glycosyl hydrolase family 28-related protein n=1 Tax=Sphingomonas sp. LHG3443-2 TaxID=2804639 RepID=UPI003CE8044C